eukprot:scaffold264787_cov13-Tisochrysis_lutea.AAC.1
MHAQLARGMGAVDRLVQNLLPVPGREQKVSGTMALISSLLILLINRSSRSSLRQSEESLRRF